MHDYYINCPANEIKSDRKTVGNGLQKLKEILNISSRSAILLFNTEGATDPVNFNSIIADNKYLKR